MYCESDPRNTEIQNEFVFRQGAATRCLSKNSVYWIILIPLSSIVITGNYLLSLACYYMLFNLLPADYLLRAHSCVLYLQQIQSNFIVVIHPGSTTLRIGRATDTLPASIPHVIARRHKQQGQPAYKDNWLLREGLNVSQSWRTWRESPRLFPWEGLDIQAYTVILNNYICSFNGF